MKNIFTLSIIIILLLAVLSGTTHADALAVINAPDTLKEGTVLTFTADGSTGDEFG